jgi:hypothetical protein
MSSDACLSLYRVYDAAMEWTQEEIDDDEVHITCEGVQTVCQSILSTVTELVKGPATSYLVPLFTLIYKVLLHLLLPSYLIVPCYLNNRQRYCSVWPEKDRTPFTELLADDMDEQDIHSSEDESEDAHNQSYFLI